MIMRYMRCCYFMSVSSILAMNSSSNMSHLCTQLEQMRQKTEQRINADFAQITLNPPPGQLIPIGHLDSNLKNAGTCESARLAAIGRAMIYNTRT